MAEPTLFKLALPSPLTDAEAFALAQLCKRITWHDCNELSANEDERDAMLRVTDKVRNALEHAGYAVR